MNVLIVKMSALGDILHTLPAVNAIKSSYPDAKITWLVEEAASDLVLGHKALDRVLVSGRKRWVDEIKRYSFRTPITELRDFIGKLRDTQYDMLFDFQGLLKSGVLIGLSRARRKIGFGRGMEHAEESHHFLTERVAAVDMEIHALIRNLILVRAVGIDAAEQDIVYDLPIEPFHRLQANSLLSQYGIGDDRPLIAIHPVAQWDTKLWLQERFSKVADHFIRNCHAHVFFTGSRDDVKIIDQIIAQMGHQGRAAINLAGATSLKTLAALYERAHLLISTDTGPMHLAAAVDTPVVALFGPTAPWRTGPFGTSHEIVRAGIDCSPCFKRKCNTTACMKEISVEEVILRAEGILQARDITNQKIRFQQL